MSLFNVSDFGFLDISYVFCFVTMAAMLFISKKEMYFLLFFVVACASRCLLCNFCFHGNLCWFLFCAPRCRPHSLSFSVCHIDAKRKRAALLEWSSTSFLHFELRIRSVAHICKVFTSSFFHFQFRCARVHFVTGGRCPC